MGNGCDSLYGLAAGDGVRAVFDEEELEIASGTGGGGWFGGPVCGGEAVGLG